MFDSAIKKKSGERFAGIGVYGTNFTDWRPKKGWQTNQINWVAL
jgi:hypothetical protein